MPVILLEDINPFLGLILVIIGCIALAFVAGAFNMGVSKVLDNKNEIREGAESVINKVRSIGISDYEACINEIERKLLIDTKYSLLNLENSVKAKEEINKNPSFIRDKAKRDAAYQFELLTGFVKEVNVNEILRFFSDKVNFKEDYISESIFLDCLGIENFKPISKIIKEVDGKFWRNRITSAELDKIKFFILTKYIILDKYLSKNI